MSLVLYEVCPWSFWCTYRSSRQASWTVLYQDAACKQAATGIWSYPWLKAHTHIRTNNYSNTFIQKTFIQIHSFKHIQSHTYQNNHTNRFIQTFMHSITHKKHSNKNIHSHTIIHIHVSHKYSDRNTNIFPNILAYTSIYIRLWSSVCTIMGIPSLLYSHSNFLTIKLY